MIITILEAQELLGIDKFEVNDGKPHIVIDKEICRKCSRKSCLVVCPAALYKLDENGDISFDYAGCLECGTCRIMCEGKGIVKWEYPEGSFGVSYRYG